MTPPAVTRAREVEVRRRPVATCGSAQRTQQQAPAARSHPGVRQHPEHGAEISSRERVRRAGSDANRDPRGRAVVRRPRPKPRRVIPFFLNSRVRFPRFVARLVVARGVCEPFQQFTEQVRLVGGGAGRDGIRQQSREDVEDPRPQRRLIGTERLRGPSPASAQQRRDHRERARVSNHRAGSRISAILGEVGVDRQLQNLGQQRPRGGSVPPRRAQRRVERFVAHVPPKRRRGVFRLGQQTSQRGQHVQHDELSNPRVAVLPVEQADHLHVGFPVGFRGRQVRPDRGASRTGQRRAEPREKRRQSRRVAIGPRRRLPGAG